MKKFVSFLLALMMIFWSSTLAFATDKTDTQDNSTSDESDGGSMPTDFAIILLLIAGGTTVASLNATEMTVTITMNPMMTRKKKFDFTLLKTTKPTEYNRCICRLDLFLIKLFNLKKFFVHSVCNIKIICKVSQ